MEDCSSSIASFCMQLRSYCLQLEASCATLRASVNHPPSSLPSPNLASLLTTLIDRVSSTSQAIAKLESKTTGIVSFQELLGHSMEIYKQNEASINALEERLKEYGYTVPEISLNNEPEELAKSFDLCELSSEAAVLNLSRSSNEEGVISTSSETKKSLPVFSHLNEQLRSSTYQEVKEGGQYDDSFYPGTLSLEDLGLSSAALACLAEEDSSPGVNYITGAKSSSADLASQEDAQSTQEAMLPAAVEGEQMEPLVPGRDVPFFKPVEKYEYLNCPAWLKMQISYEDLNVITDRMYDVLASKEACNHVHSTLNQADITALNAGSKIKPCLLLLVKLGRLCTGHENGATVYLVVHQ